MKTTEKNLPAVKRMTTVTMAEYSAMAPAAREEFRAHVAREAAIGFAGEVVGKSKGFAALRTLMVTCGVTRKDAEAQVQDLMPEGIKSASLTSYARCIQNLLDSGADVPESAGAAVKAATGKGRNKGAGRKPRAGGKAPAEGAEGATSVGLAGSLRWNVLGLPLEAIASSGGADAPPEVTLSTLIDGLRRLGYTVERARPMVCGHDEYMSWFPRVAAARARKDRKSK